MSDKEYEIPVKVVDRRWWANQHAKDSGAAARTSSASLKPTYVEELEQKLAEKDKQLQDAIARYRGAAAEFEESRARLRREIGKEIERGRREILADLLDVVDNLDRALDAARANAGNTIDSLIQGVDIVVTRIESERRPFDPLVHEAISAVPATDAVPDGMVAGVIRHGYRIGDDVLRPASVAVAKSG